MKKFTLVELLIVVAIIGILMSLLLPSLMRAREVTKTAVCLSNNAQINQAMQVYVSKNDNFINEFADKPKKPKKRPERKK